MTQAGHTILFMHVHAQTSVVPRRHGNLMFFNVSILFNPTGDSRLFTPIGGHTVARSSHPRTSPCVWETDISEWSILV